LGFGYKGLVFCRNNDRLFNGKHNQETHCTKMGADKSAKNTPKFICPSPKVWDFDEKRRIGRP
jgi:hypothetical protein